MPTPTNAAQNVQNIPDTNYKTSNHLIIYKNIRKNQQTYQRRATASSSSASSCRTAASRAPPRRRCARSSRPTACRSPSPPTRTSSCAMWSRRGRPTSRRRSRCAAGRARGGSVCGGAFGRKNNRWRESCSLCAAPAACVYVCVCGARDVLLCRQFCSRRWYAQRTTKPAAQKKHCTDAKQKGTAPNARNLPQTRYNTRNPCGYTLQLYNTTTSAHHNTLQTTTTTIHHHHTPPPYTTATHHHNNTTNRPPASSTSARSRRPTASRWRAPRCRCAASRSRVRRARALLPAAAAAVLPSFVCLCVCVRLRLRRRLPCLARRCAGCASPFIHPYRPGLGGGQPRHRDPEVAPC